MTSNAEILCVSFRRPQRAKDMIELEDNTVIRRDGKDIVGLTIPNASSKQKDQIDGDA